MDNQNYTAEHRKCQHLTYEERVQISLRLKDGWNINQISHELGCAYNTVKNEIKRGNVSLYHGKQQRYKPNQGQKIYKEHRQNSRKQYKRLECAEFVSYVQQQFYEQNWSVDAIFGYAVTNKLFTRKQMVCTKTLYNYIDIGLIRIKNVDLPQKLKRNIKTKKVRQNKRNLGESIEERPKSIEKRNEFGHWEIDTVVGSKKSDDNVVLTIVERMTRNSIWLKIQGKTAEAVDTAINKLRKEFGDKFNEIFKTITGDNGSEFANLSRQAYNGTNVYFTHPYSSWEKGTNERHNGLLRRFIPNSKRTDAYTVDDILFM